MRDLHHYTSAILREVSEGQDFVIEERGDPVAELRPFHPVPPTRRLPNREKLLAKFPQKLVSIAAACSNGTGLEAVSRHGLYRKMLSERA